MTKTMVILVGVSGSGKSTYTAELMKDPSFLKINRDSIRQSIVGDLRYYYTRKDLDRVEKIVDGIVKLMLEAYAVLGKNIIIDNTNLKLGYLNNFVYFATNNGYDVQFKFFDTTLEQAQERVRLRDGIENVDYIAKQIEQYNQIKQHAIKHHESKIIR